MSEQYDGPLMAQKILRLQRENAVLRRELKYRLSGEHWEMNINMSVEEADRLAEQEIIYLLAHNEGAE